MDDDIIVKPAKPFVKWVGGKTQLLPQLMALMPAHYNAYYEPFLGGGAMFFYLQPTKAVVNDINKTLIYTYQTIKSDLQMLAERLDHLQTEYLQLDHDQRKLYYYARREEFNSLNHLTLRKATLMIFLNKTCFNGMYRENASGKYNVPFGDYKNPKICDYDNLAAVNKLLANVEPISGPYMDAVASAQPGDFVYFDPPYYPLSQTASFTSYSGGNFSSRDQAQLRDVFVTLDKRGCFVMLSNSASDFIKELYEDYRQDFVLAGRAINATGSGRGKIQEIVVRNY